jgi:hypothetical protein
MTCLCSSGNSRKTNLREDFSSFNSRKIELNPRSVFWSPSERMINYLQYWESRAERRCELGWALRNDGLVFTFERYGGVIPTATDRRMNVPIILRSRWVPNTDFTLQISVRIQCRWWTNHLRQDRSMRTIIEFGLNHLAFSLDRSSTIVISKSTASYRSIQG